MLDSSVLTTALNSWAKEESVQKILSVDVTSAVAKGQNYLSTVKRLKMRVIQDNGRVVTRTAILKESDVQSEAHKNFLNEMAIFKTEIKIGPASWCPAVSHLTEMRAKRLQNFHPELKWSTGTGTIVIYIGILISLELVNKSEVDINFDSSTLKNLCSSPFFNKTGNRQSKKQVVVRNPQISKMMIKNRKIIGSYKPKMYTSVLKEMEYLMAEFECTEDVLWCRLLHHEPYSSMLLEDLRVLGYKSLLVPNYLDMEHTFLVLRNLALFHGMSKLLEERGTITVSDFPPWYVFNKPAYKVWHSYIQEFASIIGKKWDPSWEPVISKLQKLSVQEIESRVEETKQLCQRFSFKVVNHGDVILPNLMFKYNWRNHPISVRLIDFQLPTYGSPCIDLTYFLYRSLKPSVRKENWTLLMEFYHSTLVATLDKFCYTGRRPTLDELSADMDKMSFLGSILFAVNYAPMPNTQGDFGSEVHKDIIFGVYNRQDSEEDLGPGIRDFVHDHLS